LAEPGRPAGVGATKDVVLPGRSLRAKFLFGFLVAGVIPLLLLVYLGLPVVAPGMMSGVLHPGGGLVFFTLVTLLGLLQLTGFYVIYTEAVGRVYRTLDDEHERLRASSARTEHVLEELRLANLRLREMSHTDELTEVGNRRNFDARLREEISRSTRFGHIFSLLMVDIDAFKRFNDEFGHPRGDAVLRALGALMRSVSREGDVPCRVGGEEFAFILPETGKADAIVFAERFRRRVEGSMMAPESRGPITVSVGLAAFPEDGKTPDEIVWAADEALYVSKRAGRNRVTAHHRPEDVSNAEGGGPPDDETEGATGREGSVTA
jgi:diguanylate cyclase (GGDEF)-like protein